MELKPLVNTNCRCESRRQQQAIRVVNLGLAANAVLSLVKTSTGILGHSQALLADGINSVSDVVYYLLVKILVKRSGQPADAEHPYGHYQLESVAAVVIGAFVITTGVVVFWNAVNSGFDLLSGAQDPKPVQIFALVVALATIVAKLTLMFNAASMAANTHNVAISALARDHRNDAIASSGVAVSILLGLAGLRWVDPLAGALVAIIIVKTGVDILRESAAELMDAVPSDAMAFRIRALIADLDEVRSVESVHAHRFGPYYVVNVTIGLDPQLSVAEGDRIADTVEILLRQEIEMVRSVYVHYHPAGDRSMRSGL